MHTCGVTFFIHTHRIYVRVVKRVRHTLYSEALFFFALLLVTTMEASIHMSIYLYMYIDAYVFFAAFLCSSITLRFSKGMVLPHLLIYTCMHIYVYLCIRMHLDYGLFGFRIVSTFFFFFSFFFFIFFCFCTLSLVSLSV